VNLFYQPLISKGALYLDQDESRHAIKVLRKKNGDIIRLTDGKGFFYEGVITDADSRQCAFEIQNTIAVKQPEYSIHIGISPTKNADRIEWFAEKSVELGIDEITLLKCDHTERQHFKVERIEKMAVGAMKQSLKARLPVIHQLTDIRSVIHSSSASEKYIAYVDEENQQQLHKVVRPRQSYFVLIGPEGDFSNEELTLAEAGGFKKISLGPSRLRTETAGLAACHILNLANRP
jgi:16S rRNA (uracil1498-N3)-methyltransferase